jgi:hypothetical protein
MLSSNGRNKNIKYKWANTSSCSEMDAPVRLAVNPADNGMAFDSPFSDYILSCLSDVSVKDIIEYTLLLLQLQERRYGNKECTYWKDWELM